jgi:DNA transposition AAA+ family ATPase
MTEDASSPAFLVTKQHRRFVEFCEACRRYRYIGLCYGPPGVGKTLSARVYAHWDRIEALYDLRLDTLPSAPEVMPCRTVFYTPTVANSPGQIKQEVAATRTKLAYLLHDMAHVLQGRPGPLITSGAPDRTELLIVDEADRLKMNSLEQLRDIYDRGQLGLILIGMPGLEKRLSRYPQLYSRVGFVHPFPALSTAEIQFVLQHKWANLGFTFDPDDFTDAETMAIISHITRGNFRLLQRLLTQIERLMQINQLQVVTKEVVEMARDFLVIGTV